MGMAASQARFLGLTARKTNTEYEGQQINQQRTALSNQSANYYNQLLGMKVPVPPAITDFTKTVYTFQDGSLSNSITSLVAQVDGDYMVSYTATYTNDFSVVGAASSIYTRSNIGTEAAPQYEYYVGSKKLRAMGTPIERDDQGRYKPENKYTDEYLSTLSKTQLDKLEQEEKRYLSELKEKYGDGTYMVRYVQNTSTKAWVPYFTKLDNLTSGNVVYNDNGSSQSNIPTYTVGSSKEQEEIKGVQARLEQDASGRIISITLNPNSPDKVTYAVTTSTVTDQAKYDDAMNQYEYDKYQYDQSIQNINSKIEIIQSEDKNLELRMKQLDTEQKAIQTEMDAVQKVIEKNTESTFKTFG